VKPPTFLDLPDRQVKPRSRGVTHVLDKGMGLAQTEGLLDHVAGLIDIVKIGWGIGYVDPGLAPKVAAYRAADVHVCLGGTLLEVSESQGRVAELREWALKVGITAIEVSDGLCALDRRRKSELVHELSRDFVVAAEVGSKDSATPVVAAEWLADMRADLEAGATWVIAEGRESGTVGIYDSDGGVRGDLVDTLLTTIPLDRIIFEAPHKAQQTWFVRNFGAEVNLGNIPPDEVLPLETLRLGLRADTAVVHRREATAAAAAT
jgi:phosphosulfolactate synthase